jgi:hypothetical protein
MIVQNNKSLLFKFIKVIKHLSREMGKSHLLFYPTCRYNIPMENKIIKNDKFRRVAANVKPDSKKRLSISKACQANEVTYHVYCNEIGQIILDPQISIPASEIWLYSDPEARAAVVTGLKEASRGKIAKINLDEL